MSSLATRNSTNRSAVLGYLSLFTSLSTLGVLRVAVVACGVWLRCIGYVAALIHALACNLITPQGVDVLNIRNTDCIELHQHVLRCSTSKTRRHLQCGRPFSLSRSEPRINGFALALRWNVCNRFFRSVCIGTNIDHTGQGRCVTHTTCVTLKPKICRAIFSKTRARPADM